MIEWLTDDATLRSMPDADLLRAYLGSDGQGAEAAKLLDEIQRRDLDV